MIYTKWCLDFTIGHSQEIRETLNGLDNGELRPQNGWGKKKWCCSNKGIGCQEGQWPSGVWWWWWWWWWWWCVWHDSCWWNLWKIGLSAVPSFCPRRWKVPCWFSLHFSWELTLFFFTLLPFCFDTNVINYAVIYNISVSILPCLRNVMICCLSSLPRGTFWGHYSSWQHWYVSGLACFPAQTAPSDDSPWLCYEKPEVGA